MANLETLISADMAPAMPPSLASIHNKSTDEIIADLNKMPLFMTTLEDNDDLEAIRALAYEGSPLEVASNFKDNGNECYAKKSWEDAKQFYAQAINALTPEVCGRQCGEEMKDCEKSDRGKDEHEKKPELSLLVICLVNRAACHLELRNYRSCIQDCGKALQIDRRNIKAYYRSSRALLALDRIVEARDACVHGLAIDSKNSSLCSIAKAIEQQSSILAAKEQQRLERTRRNLLEAKTLNAALLARNITLRKTDKPPEMEDARIKLVPDPGDPTSTLCFPTLFLYPLQLESDFIKAFNETECIDNHLEYILPLPWDSENTYTSSQVECYVESISGDLCRVGKKTSLLKLLTVCNVEILDEIVKIFVLPRSKAAAWLKETKRQKVK